MTELLTYKRLTNERNEQLAGVEVYDEDDGDGSYMRIKFYRPDGKLDYYGCELIVGLREDKVELQINKYGAEDSVDLRTLFSTTLP